ncbi:MAG: YdjY domain-containing protein [Lentisphaeria bacterium]|nr:YdjY domain-containing protein [Lentisphaeria bacterium]
MIVKYSLLTLLLFGFSAVQADNGAPAPDADKPGAADTTAPKTDTPVEKNVVIEGDNITFPGLTINRKTREVRMDASVCLESGILEYLVCLPDTFEHEAIFVTTVKPEILHTALLLAGLKPTPMPPGLEQLWWERALKVADSRVRVEVEWDINGRTERTNIISLIRNRQGGDEDMWGGEAAAAEEEPEEVTDSWVFTGSFLHTQKNGERVYAANFGGVVIGIWPNPSAVIQYGKESKNPYHGPGFGMEVNDEFVPKKGTPVKLVFSKYVPPRNEVLEK